MVKSFEGEEEYFEVDALLDGEPVERVENGSDVFTGPGVGEEAGSRVLDHLESMEGMGGDASKEGVAVVEVRGDEGVDEGFSGRGGRQCLILAMRRRWKYEVLTMWLTWGVKVRVGSMMTPRLRTRVEGVMVEESMVSEMGPVLLRVDLVPMRRSSVLSLFSLRKL